MESNAKANNKDERKPIRSAKAPENVGNKDNVAENIPETIPASISEKPYTLER